MNKFFPFMLIIFFLLSIRLHAQVGQISIDRIESMPNLPYPLNIRNWQKTTAQYDSLIFDTKAQGTYLPLIFTGPGINYPEHDNFGLYSYVGSKNASAEAINVLPALISATLIGIDKSNQNGANWVLMAEDFFNRRPEENVYLNNFRGSSGNDWWYDTMPNVFFYQLYNLYPNTGHFQSQFTMVADRWLQAVKAMGGSSTPWAIPNFYHRAWALSTMMPNDDGVKEPEAAGAIGWILYMAYLQTGNEKYRIGAEWSLEYLNNFAANPFYELQLAYGVYIAARMNAELDTQYNIKKMLNWCFDPEGNVRGWAAVVGNWGGYDCSGLIGQVIGDDYAFAMNTFEMIGALVPMVRYDERFGRTIGKWVLNAVNASRLFYSNALPAENQDGENWAWQYDPQGVIAYEALREKDWYSNTTPFATGDALRSGWAATNLALYGASHVGILGAIVDTTNVTGILKLNVRATDYFSSNPLPMFLLYNPYEEDTTVVLNVGDDAVRIYDVISNQNLKENVQGATSLTIKADQAVLLCLLPQNTGICFEREKMLVNGFVVDFHAREFTGNHKPRIKALAASQTSVGYTQTIKVYCTAEDRDGDALTYHWTADHGSFSGQGAIVHWTAPQKNELCSIDVRVSDGTEEDSASVKVTVNNNHLPIINAIEAQPKETLPGDTVWLTCSASDEDGDSLSFRWWVQSDTIATAAQADWVAPQAKGFYWLNCMARDGNGGQAEDSVGVADGDLVIRLLLNGNAMDSSPFRNSGRICGTQEAIDHNGKSGGALHFDGESDCILIPNHPSLNFQKEITVSFWMKADTFFTREAYPASHGNWENRWKVSITNRRVRWTVKTERGIYDLDSQQELSKNRFYLVTCTYDGAQMKVFLNGAVNAQKSCSGKILPTSYDLVLGQALAGNTQYGFEGVLDYFYLFNRALDDAEVKKLYDTQTAIEIDKNGQYPKTLQLEQNFPNPFNPSTVIRYYLPWQARVRLNVYDVQGRRIQILADDVENSGWHKLRWKAQSAASGIYFFCLQAGLKTLVKKGLKVK